MQRNTTDFSTGSVKKRIIAQAVPLTLAQAVQLLYNIVDRIYIGHLPDIGQMALTGLGITFPLVVLIAAFTQLVGVGGTPLFSIARGKKNEKAGSSPGRHRRRDLRQPAGSGKDQGYSCGIHGRASEAGADQRLS